MNNSHLFLISFVVFILLPLCYIMLIQESGTHKRGKRSHHKHEIKVRQVGEVDLILEEQELALFARKSSSKKRGQHKTNFENVRVVSVVDNVQQQVVCANLAGKVFHFFSLLFT